MVNETYLWQKLLFIGSKMAEGLVAKRILVLLLTWLDDKGANICLPRLHQLMQAARSLEDRNVRELYLADQRKDVGKKCTPLFNEYMLRIMCFKQLPDKYKVTPVFLSHCKNAPDHSVV
jgi:hypothetical protein